MANIPLTTAKRSLAYEHSSETASKKAKGKYKTPRLNNETVAQIIKTNNVRNDLDLYALAKKQAAEGKDDPQNVLT